GVKMLRRGKSFYGDDIQGLGALAAAGDFVDGTGQVVDMPMAERYVARVAADYHGDRDLKVAWDPGNGAAGEVLRMLLEKLPGTHVVFNDEIDGTFPAHHPDPTVEKNLVQLKDAVAREGCDVGFAFDGDGDRIGVIDGKGRVLWGDQLMVVLAEEVLADQPGATIIADVKASQVFVDEIRRLGGNPLIYKTGHSLIKTKMQETGAPLAGEMSAHIFFKHRYYGYDDALYSAVRLMSILASTPQTLAQRRDAMPQLVNTPELRFDCADGRKFQVIEEVRARIAGTPGLEVNDIDGVRVLNDDGWWLLRASNTQAVLVARCESATQEGLARLKAAVVEQLAASGLSAPDFD
ncbi:MAG: phosphomannomutase/phosphoglucomutase, partial [Hyphomicrobiales bacterium]|nr:phosphomannomutase/phosphoglucomutase [Hyphomicrobiales bacterium]